MSAYKDFIIYGSVLIFSTATFFFFLKIGPKKIAKVVTAHPALFITIPIVVVALLGLGMKNLSMEPDIKALLPEDMPSKITFNEVEKTFGGMDTVFIVLTAKQGDIWKGEALNSISQISNALKSAPYVDKVLSLTEAKNIVNEDGMIVIDNLIDQKTDFSSTADLEKAHQAARSSKLLYKRLVSNDERSTIIIVTVRLNTSVVQDNGKTITRFITDREICAPDPAHPDTPTLLNIKEKYKDAPFNISLSGFPYLRYYNSLKMRTDMKLFLGLGTLLMLGFLYLSFRTLRGALLPIFVVLLGIAASFGFMGWMNEKIALPFLLMGPMLIAIAHSYGTQLIAKYYEDIQDTEGAIDEAKKKDISGNCIRSIGAPAFISAVTTVIGFVTMVSHPVRALGLLGFFCAFGITTSFILTIIMTPSILTLLKIPRMLIEKGHGQLTDKVLKKIADFTDKRRKLFLVFYIGLVISCFVSIPRIEVDTNMMNYYPRESDIRKAADLVSSKFGGYSTLNIMVTATHPVAQDASEDGPMKNPSILNWMADFQHYAESLKDPETKKPMIGDVISIVDYLSHMNEVMQNDPAKNRVPETRELVAQYMLSYEDQGQQGSFSNLVDYKYNKAQIVIRLPDMSTKRLNTVVDSLKSYIDKHPSKEIDVLFSGTVMVLADIAGLIVDGQVMSLALSLVIIMLCYMIMFRSVAAGLLSAVPLGLSIALVFALMGLFGINLDYITATLTGIAMGAGTDYTAYFLWRLREKIHLTNSFEEGNMATMVSIGKGIVYNGLSVVIGFFVFFLSNFMPIRFFGFLISFSILVCVIGALSALPMTIFFTRPKFLQATQKKYL